MAVNETTTVVEEYEYSEDGFLVKKTTTTTTRPLSPTYHPGGWYPTPSKPLQIWNDHQFNHEYKPAIWNDHVQPCSNVIPFPTKRSEGYL